eukprot:m.205305 g.205305  ORF g.205305 m.205305 type:complete len:416 (-) comp15014_c1_seq2:4970-6217(-)
MAASALLKSLHRPDELASLVYFQFLGGKKKIFPPNDVSEETESMRECYDWLDKTSRSFAAVIQALHPAVRKGICIFYLVLRGLDTVEDDMTIDSALKDELLRSFHEKLYQPGWTFDGNAPTEKDRGLLVHFSVVIDEFLRLEPALSVVIADICKQMGEGMAIYQTKQVKTMADYNEYCHYVAGLVGIGLSRLFSASGLESEEVGSDHRLANSMGLFLQKTNIIRDYLEDLEENRTWWPEQVWSKYTAKLSDFARPENRKQALECLNHLVADALGHVPDCYKYMARIKTETIFNFCAIPQVMAIATLSLCYNNGSVFEQNVKIRRGTAVQLMMKATNMQNILEIFSQYSVELRRKFNPSNQTAPTMRSRLDVIDRDTDTYMAQFGGKPATGSRPFAFATVLLVAGLGLYYYKKSFQ